MRFHHFVHSAALACCFAAPATAADMVTGTMTTTNSFLGYMGVMTDISTTGGTTLPTSAFAFCIEGSLDWAGTGGPRQYTVAGSFAAFLNAPQTVDKATAMLHYVVDNYYIPLIEGQFGARSGYGFNQAVWQLTDFNGSRESMRVHPDDDGEDVRGDYALYATIMGDLYDNFSSIAPSYRSTQYNIVYLQENDPAYQSLALVTAVTQPVPEPSSLLMMLAGGACIAGTVLRRRKASPSA